MQRSFECSVCSDFYVPGTRPPKTLSCGHSFCSPCLHILYKGSTLNCPKCQTTCSLSGNKIEKLPTSYAILEMLDSVCGECHNQPHNGKCGHCDKNVCDPCREVHMAASQSDSSADYDTLKALITRLNDKLSDDRSLKAITTKRDQTIKKLQQLKDEQISLIEKHFIEKVDKVKVVSQEEMEKMLTHNDKISDFLTEARKLLDRMRKQQYLGSNTAPGMKNEHGKMVKLLHDLEKEELSTSTFDCYLNKEEFIAALSKSFKLLIKKSDDTSMISQYRPAPDYTQYEARAIFKDGLKSPMGVSINPRTGDIIVTNYDTHKVHILSDDLKLLHTLVPGGETGGFRYPHGVACDGDAIYIADSDNNRVCVTDIQGNTVWVFGTKGSGQDNFNDPRGLALDSTGHVYVCDYGNQRVKVTNKEGLYLRDFGNDIFGEENPWFISVSSDNKVAVTDWSGNLYLFTTSGQHIRTIKGKTPPHNIKVNAAVFDSHGNIVVTDEGGRVVVMSEAGEVRCVIGSPGTGRGELWWPQCLAITTKGELVVCDRGNNRLQLFSAK